MRRDVVLVRVAMLHAILLALLVAALASRELPVKGALLGGGLAGFSFVTFWVIARSITEPSKKAPAIALGSLKIVFYLALTGMVLSGRLSADPLGFALGVTCFVVATVVAALAGSPSQTDRRVGEVGGV